MVAVMTAAIHRGPFHGVALARASLAFVPVLFTKSHLRLAIVVNVRLRATLSARWRLFARPLLIDTRKSN